MTASLGRPVRVALDLMGGDNAPGAVVDAVRLLAARSPEIDVVLVGPADLAADALGDVAGLHLVVADDVVAMAEDPGRAVRRKPGSTVRVALDLLAAGSVDAVVSAGSTGATIAAAHLALGRSETLSRSVLAAVVPALANPVVVVDVGGNLSATAEVLAEQAVYGSAYASVRFGLDHPRVGLLSVGVERGKGDELRREAFELIEASLAGRGAVWCGNVEGSDIPLGSVDVVVTDGFTGNVLLKALEGALTLFSGTVARVADAAAAEAAAVATEGLHPDRQGGALLLGVPCVVVIGHGASTAEAVAGCVELAAMAAAERWSAAISASVTGQPAAVAATEAVPDAGKTRVRDAAAAAIG
ncbi:MAG: phosphate acyltransferase [Frankiaceae bacterium]|nr:phosphate acyltransferase [Frankiaceae bacterium]